MHELKRTRLISQYKHDMRMSKMDTSTIMVSSLVQRLFVFWRIDRCLVSWIESQHIRDVWKRVVEIRHVIQVAFILCRRAYLSDEIKCMPNWPRLVLKSHYIYLYVCGYWCWRQMNRGNWQSTVRNSHPSRLCGVQWRRIFRTASPFWGEVITH